MWAFWSNNFNDFLSLMPEIDLGLGQKPDRKEQKIVIEEFDI